MLRRHAGTSTAKKSVKRQLTISRKGWDVVWAAKKQKLLNILEDAYPNVLNIDDLARCVLASFLSLFHLLAWIHSVCFYGSQCYDVCCLVIPRQTHGVETTMNFRVGQKNVTMT